jgi:DNA polymerase-3 subunit gamma/tau
VASLRELATGIPPEEVQLYYQIALNGQRDLPLAPDARSGFEMVMLRMLAFRPDGAARVEPDQRPGRKPKQGETPRSGAATGGGGSENAPVTRGGQAAPVTRPQPAVKPEAGDQAGFADWHAFVAALGLKGMAAQLADNCVFQGWDGKQLSLCVDPVCSGLIGSLAEQRLQEAVSAAADRPVKLHLLAQASETETPAQRLARENDARQAATEADVSDDPVVLALEESFDAKIVPDSIRRIE